jgi:hypothetical protein
MQLFQAPPLAASSGYRLVDANGAFASGPAYNGTTVANIDIVNLAGWNEVVVHIKGLTASASGARQFLASINNGSSFLTGASDYTAISSTGAASGTSAFGIVNASGTAAQSGLIRLLDFSATTPKLIVTGRTDFPIGSIDTANALNAIRIINSSGNLNGGQVYVWVR